MGAGAVYNYTVHSLPTGGKDALSKLRTFLIAQGWTSEDYQTSVDWLSDGDGTYSWQAGNHDFLQMKSNGYGHQNLRMRFFVEYDSGYTNHLKFYSSMMDPTVGPAPQETNYLNPIYHDEWYTRYNKWLSVPSGTFNELYLIGNNKFCFVGFRCTATTFIQFNFGTPELLPEYRKTKELQMRMPGQTTYDSDDTWDDIDLGLNQGSFHKPWAIRTGDTGFEWLWYDGDGCNYLEAKFNVGFFGSEVAGWNLFRNVRRVNSWSGKRLIVRNGMFVENSVGQWEHIGYHPCRLLSVSGLALGEIIEYGDEQFMIFVTPAFGAEDGYCLRIA